MRKFVLVYKSFPADSIRWSAVSHGAVLWGLDQASDERRGSSDSSQSFPDSLDPALFATALPPKMNPVISTIVARRVRHSYGVQVVEPCIVTKPLSVDKELDSNLKESVAQHICWLLKRVFDPFCFNRH
jgi:hypothetical protein